MRLVGIIIGIMLICYGHPVMGILVMFLLR